MVASNTVLEEDIKLLTAAEAALKSITGLPPALKAVDKALEAAIKAEIAILENEVACYVRGTLIVTEAGAMAVEDLKVGDRVVTASGELRSIVWLGHRGFDLSSHPHPQPERVRPILVRAGAFADNIPARDLWLSPGHNVFFDGALIPIVYLVNGVTIVRQPRAQFEYWHVELNQHDIVLAEGLPAESYFDTGNRSAFVGVGTFVEQHPDFGPKHSAGTCAPIVHEGPRLVAAREWLLKRLETFGYKVTDDADLHLIADGARIEPIELGDHRYAFIAPAGGVDIALASRTFIPEECEAVSRDTRRLGVCVADLQINGMTVDLMDDSFVVGWHELERWDDGVGRRWTSGSAFIPGYARLVVVKLAARGYYMARTAEAAVKLVA